jgi:putative membrane protein
MKKTEMILRSFLFASMLSLFTVVSCKQGPKTEDSEEVATEQNDEKFDNNDNKEDDSEILVAAAETNLEEIEVGKLAQTKGTSAHVKEMGKMLESDHSKALSELQALAAKKSISLPTVVTDDSKEHYADLNGKQAGKDFDRKFADMMVDGHEKAIKKMEDASENANDAEVRTWAAGVLPTLKMHLEHAKMIQDELK